MGRQDLERRHVVWCLAVYLTNNYTSIMELMVLRLKSHGNTRLLTRTGLSWKWNSRGREVNGPVVLEAPAVFLEPGQQPPSASLRVGDADSPGPKTFSGRHNPLFSSICSSLSTYLGGQGG